MRSVTRCAAFGARRWSSAERAPVWLVRICRLIYTPLWSEGMVAGRGWIALALVTFATWRPDRLVLGAYLFGGVTMLQFYLQGQGRRSSGAVAGNDSVHGDDRRARTDLARPALAPLNMPASLGKPFSPNL